MHYVTTGIPTRAEWKHSALSVQVYSLLDEIHTADRTAPGSGIGFLALAFHGTIKHGSSLNRILDGTCLRGLFRVFRAASGEREKCRKRHGGGDAYVSQHEYRLFL